MDHQQAAESMTVEKYLLDELSPEMRDKFEEHFFDCQECATDVRATAAFMDAAKQEFRLNPLSKPKAPASSKPRIAFLRPALAWSALAASLLVIGYQNAVLLPHYKTEVAELQAPEILPSVSLVSGNSRGGQIPVVALGRAHSFLVSFDIPTQDRFSGYTCLLYSPSGSLVSQVDVSAQSARDTVSMRVPSANRSPGEYILRVQGTGDQGATGSAAEVAHFTFTLSNLP